MLDDDEFCAWFRLLEAPGLSRRTQRALLTAFGSPEAVWSMTADRLRHVAGEEAAQALRGPDPTVEARLATALEWRRGGADRHAIAVGEPHYPPLLLQTVDPPLMIYVLGDPAVLSLPGVAIVGSRNPTPQGLENARAFGRHLSDAGWAVVSGLALGIDGAAHEGALAGRTPTIAVVGTGPDRVYPSRHRQLAHRISQGGAIVSEFSPGMPALPPNFPQRNRIIAGLTRGTLVVEAALQSGSLITARLASEAGREVFAIPGSIHSPLARGCHALLKQGAKLVESADDVLEELYGLGLLPPPVGPVADSTPPDALLAAMGHDPVTLDVLGMRTGCGAAELAARLLELELAGQVSRLPGGLYQRRMSA